jgi:hypothetical protein
MYKIHDEICKNREALESFINILFVTTPFEKTWNNMICCVDVDSIEERRSKLKIQRLEQIQYNFIKKYNYIHNIGFNVFYSRMYLAITTNNYNSINDTVNLFFKNDSTDSDDMNITNTKHQLDKFINFLRDIIINSNTI